MYKINILSAEESETPVKSHRRIVSQSTNYSPAAKPIIKFSTNAPKLPALLSPNSSRTHIKGSLSPVQSSSNMGRHSMTKTTKKAFTPVFKVPKLLKAVSPLKSNGLIKSYAANTSTGIVRGYNEDRISISYRISKPKSKFYDSWPSCSWFGLFDGHGGEQCADFLRDNLLHYVVNQDSFPTNPRTALLDGFREAETCFNQFAMSTPEKIERSGSCAIIVLIVGSTAYIANVGDSRAVASLDNGSVHEDLSSDHKPNEPNERARIYKHGGDVYFRTGSTFISYATGENEDSIIYRVLPGRLSVSRTFGDIDAKFPHFNGKPGVVIADPEIRVFEIRDQYDFIVMGCDGIFDKLSSAEVVRHIWQEAAGHAAGNFHSHCGAVVNGLLTRAMEVLSTDNVTVVLIAFKGFQRHFKRIQLA